MKYAFFYILSVVGINLAFEYIPPFVLHDGTIWSVGSVIAGIVFVTRDYAQRAVGHVAVFGLMITAGAISYAMASPFVAIASLLAFGASEMIDYIVYTLNKGSFKSKVIASSLISVPVDTFVFLKVIEHVSLFSFIVMCLSKLIVIAWIYKRGDI
ncbi:putative vitamin uptake transporter [Vibrio phage BUCT006]|nr:putative vitamin uptake transporter [Vibrio phage BUCT006]